MPGATAELAQGVLVTTAHTTSAALSRSPASRTSTIATRAARECLDGFLLSDPTLNSSGNEKANRSSRA
jgi:hypothetical protein